MVKKGEEKSGIIKRADAGAAAKAYKVSVEKYKTTKKTLRKQYFGTIDLMDIKTKIK